MKITGRMYSRLLRMPAHCDGGLTSILTVVGRQLRRRYAQADELIHKGGRGLLVRFTLLAGLVHDLDGVVILDDDARHTACSGYRGPLR